jgi:hypothetical protein
MDKESEDEQLEKYIRKIARDEVRDEEDREKGIDIDIHILNLPRKTKRFTIILDDEISKEVT